MGPDRAEPIIAAVNAFAEQERLRWQQMRTGTPPPIEAPPQEQMEALVDEAYQLLEARRTAEACDRWLAAWEIAKTSSPHACAPQRISRRLIQAVSSISGTGV